MAEDWNAIAAEVDDALKEVSDISQADGFKATLRKVSVSGGDPWNPGSGTETVTYTALTVIDSEIRDRDRDGSLVGTKRRTLTVGTGAGVVPSEDDRVFVGSALTYVDEDTDASIAWQEIDEVYTLAPAGVAVIYEIDLVI
jgi:hypothetical protein